MNIAEFFVSIQGEGPDSGLACIFIRTAGCNLACTWCDTGYARQGGRDTVIREIVERCVAVRKDKGPGLVCLTGGEPMLQPDTPELLERLVSAGFRVSMMTNGTMDPGAIPAAVRLLVDIKLCLVAVRGGAYPHPAILAGPRDCSRDAMKFVITDRAAFDLAVAWSNTHGVFERFGTVLVSPAWGILNPSDLADWILESEPRFRLGLQLHKHIWGPDTRK